MTEITVQESCLAPHGVCLTPDAAEIASKAVVDYRARGITKTVTRQLRPPAEIHVVRLPVSLAESTQRSIHVSPHTEIARWRVCKETPRHR